MHSDQLGKEQKFEESEILLSITDLDSHIKYANAQFCNIAGYSLEELTAKPHNIVRHPDMPKAAFSNLWSFVEQGKPWMGPVKNRCKNGDYYWVNAYVTPIKDANGKNMEYQSVRTKLEPHIQRRASALYSTLNEGKTPSVLKYKTDQTLWFQALFMLFSLASLALVIFSEINIGFTLPFLMISIGACILSVRWRKKYIRVVNDALSVFDNPLMSYVYSGNNDAIGSIQLALSMRTAEINAVVGRVSDVSEHVSKSATVSSEQSHQVSSSLKEQRL
ncbi:MAG: PAS domain-containing protein [Psychrobium sp.]|nr:PAS domain-containing protein [Psychrobium sp.]